MNKKTKGLVSLALGAALVAGSASTFALCTDTRALGTGATEIQTGDLRFHNSVTGAWYWLNQSYGTAKNTTGTTNVQGATRTGFTSGKLVPGDAIQYVFSADTIQYILRGETIVATLYLDGLQVQADSNGFLQIPYGTAPNAGVFTTNLKLIVTDSSGTPLTRNSDGSYTIKASVDKTAESGSGSEYSSVNVPIIKLGFPLHYNSETPAPEGVVPGETVSGQIGNAWSRNIGTTSHANVTTAHVLNAAANGGFQIRLTQQTGDAPYGS